MRKFLVITGLLALVAGPVSAQSPKVFIDMEPVEIDTFDCEFVSWTLDDAGTATVTVSGTPHTPDAAPGDVLVGGPTLVGTQHIQVVLNPDASCGVSGCRNRNDYQIKLNPSGPGVAPTCNFVIRVKEVTF